MSFNFSLKDVIVFAASVIVSGGIALLFHLIQKRERKREHQEQTQEIIRGAPSAWGKDLIEIVEAALQKYETQKHKPANEAIRHAAYADTFLRLLTATMPTGPYAGIVTPEFKAEASRRLTNALLQVSPPDGRNQPTYGSTSDGSEK